MLDPSSLNVALGTVEVSAEYDRWMTTRHPLVKKSEVPKKDYLRYFFTFLSENRCKAWKMYFANGKSDFYDFLFLNFKYLPIKQMISSVIMGNDVRKGIWLHFEDAHKNMETLLQVLEYVTLPEEFINTYDMLQPCLWDGSEASIKFLSILFHLQKIPCKVIAKYFDLIAKNDSIRNALISSKYRSYYESKYGVLFRKLMKMH